MPTTVPSPVAAALGLVPAVLGGVRRLPAKAVQLPILALSSALAGMDLAKREYGDLSERGERLVARLRGGSFDELEDRVEDALAGTPVAGLYDKVEDTLEDVADTVGKAATAARARVGTAADRAAESVPERDDAVSDAEQPKGKATPKATEPDSTRIDTAAAPDVVAAVEKVAAKVSVAPTASAGDLPLADYDHLTLGALRGQLRSLEVDQLVQLRSYEKSKADRLPVVTMLDNRIAKLAAGASQPTGNTPDTPSPKASAAVKPPKKVGKTAGAKSDSPPHTKVRLT